MRCQNLVVGLVACALLVTAVPSIAQIGALDEIIVTAQKREENLLDVPISMTVVQAETLTDLNIKDFTDLQVYIPNFAITQTPANSYVFVRGIGTQGNVLAFESSVALFVDGIYGGRNRQFQDPFLDLERMEVLRGPQGALFGRNTSAGAVSVTTARPTKDPLLRLQADYEFEFGSWSLQGVGSGPVSDNVQMRLAARYADTAGFIRNTFLNRDEPAKEDKSVRWSTAWQPSDKVDVLAKIEYNDSTTIGMPFEFVPGGGQPMFTKRADDGFAPERDDSEALNGLIRADFELAGDHTLTAIAGYSSFEYANAINIQAIAPAHLVVANNEDFDQNSLELRLLSPTGGKFEYVAGLYYDDGDTVIGSQSTTDVPFTPAYPEGVTTRRYTESNDSYAAFAQGTWRVTDAVRLTGGVRYTHVEKDVSLRRSFVGFAPGARNDPIDDKRKENFFNPSANLQWDVNDRWMLFASYANGSKSGGYNGPTSSDPPATYEYEDESSSSIEVGAKGRFDKGFLSIVLFDTDYEDLQKSVLNILTQSFTTGNAAKANSRGVEVEAAWQPLDALRFNTSFAYLDAKFDDYPGAICPFGAPMAPSCNLAGYPLTSAPELSGNVAANLELPVSAGLLFRSNLTATYRSKIFFQPSYNPLEAQDGFWKLDLRAGIAAADDRWDASVVVRNLTDKQTANLIFETFPFFINPAVDRVYLPDLPRTYALQMRYRFD
ncbi:MAG: TonB-dependent receptor [Steroidobacteraceae bacterium]